MGFFKDLYRKMRGAIKGDRYEKQYQGLVNIFRTTSPLTPSDLTNIENILHTLVVNKETLHMKFSYVREALRLRRSGGSSNRNLKSRYGMFITDEYNKLVRRKINPDRDVSYYVNGNVVYGEVQSSEEEDYFNRNNIKTLNSAPLPKKQCDLDCVTNECRVCLERRIRKELVHNMELERSLKEQERIKRRKNADERSIITDINEQLGCPLIIGRAFADDRFSLDDLESEEKEEFLQWREKNRKLASGMDKSSAKTGYEMMKNRNAPAVGVTAFGQEKGFHRTAEATKQETEVMAAEHPQLSTPANPFAGMGLASPPSPGFGPSKSGFSGLAFESVANTGHHRTSTTEAAEQSRMGEHIQGADKNEPDILSNRITNPFIDTLSGASVGEERAKPEQAASPDRKSFSNPFLSSFGTEVTTKKAGPSSTDESPGSPFRSLLNPATEKPEGSLLPEKLSPATTEQSPHRTPQFSRMFSVKEPGKVEEENKAEQKVSAFSNATDTSPFQPFGTGANVPYAPTKPLFNIPPEYNFGVTQSNEPAPLQPHPFATSGFQTAPAIDNPSFFVKPAENPLPSNPVFPASAPLQAPVASNPSNPFISQNFSQTNIFQTTKQADPADSFNVDIFGGNNEDTAGDIRRRARRRR